MGVFSGGKKWRRLAAGVDAKIYNLEKEAAYMQSNRELLSEIRKARLAASQQEYMVDQTSGEYIQNTGQFAATSNIYSTFAGAYKYSMDLNQIGEDVEKLELISQKFKKRAARQDKRAATAAQITVELTGAAGAAIVRAAGGGDVARKVANKAAINYAITGATMAAGGFLNAGGAGGQAVTNVTGQAESIAASSGGQITMTNAAYTGPTVAAPSTSTEWLSSAKQIGQGLSMANQIKTALTPDYSYVEDRYRKSLYRRRYNRIYA